MTETATPPAKGLITKLSEVMAEVERVAKHGRNDFHKYDYATEADIAAAVRQHMAARHLLMVPSVEALGWRDGKKDGGAPIATLTVKFRVYDGDSGETLEFTVLGEGQDSGDKATYKAMTGANKYALLKMFQIPTGDDPEREDGPARRRNGRQEATPAQRQAVADAAPYADREPPVADAPPATAEPPLDLLALRAGLPKDCQAHVPDDEATLLMPNPEEDQHRGFYVAAIRDKAKTMKLNASEKGDLMLQFFGARRAQLDGQARNIYFLKALYFHLGGAS